VLVLGGARATDGKRRRHARLRRAAPRFGCKRARAPVRVRGRWSAFALGAFYLMLASALWRRTGENLRLLTSRFSRSRGFRHARDPARVRRRITSAAWASRRGDRLGERAQSRVLGLVFGLALQFAAG